MNKNLENKYIDTDWTEFYNIVSRRAKEKDFFPQLENEIYDIYKSKKIHPNNIVELTTWAAITGNDYKHHYEMLKDAIKYGVCPTCAIKMVEQNISDTEIIFNYICEYFYFHIDENQTAIINWREENE